MKRFLVIALFVAVLATLGAAPASAAKQTICHFPPGDPADFHTLVVGGGAVDAHVDNHGDLLGSCLESCEAICDDGNACTIDVLPDPEACVCTAEPRPQVDCSDGNSCTADACDSVNGTCTNDPGPLNGNVCEDGNAGTIDEICFNGSCDPPCPCFTGADIVANGAVAQCGSNFPGFPDLTGFIFANGGRACSGSLCAGPGLTCLLSTPVSGLTILTVTPQEDQNCRALLLNYCENPNVVDPSLSGDESDTPFIDG